MPDIWKGRGRGFRDPDGSREAANPGWQPLSFVMENTVLPLPDTAKKRKAYIGRGKIPVN